MQSAGRDFRNEERFGSCSRGEYVVKAACKWVCSGVVAHSLLHASCSPHKIPDATASFSNHPGDTRHAQNTTHPEQQHTCHSITTINHPTNQYATRGQRNMHTAPPLRPQPFNSQPLTRAPAWTETSVQHPPLEKTNAELSLIVKTIARHPRRLTNTTSPPPIRPLQFLNTDRRLDKEGTAASATEVNQGSQTTHHAPQTMPEKCRCPSQGGCPVRESVGLRETATQWNPATATPPTLHDTMPTSGYQSGFHFLTPPPNAPHSIPKKSRCPNHCVHLTCERTTNTNQTAPLLRPLQKQYRVHQREQTRTDAREIKVPQPSPPDRKPPEPLPPSIMATPQRTRKHSHLEQNDKQRTTTTAMSTATTTHLTRDHASNPRCFSSDCSRPTVKPTNTAHSPQPTPDKWRRMRTPPR